MWHTTSRLPLLLLLVFLVLEDQVQARSAGSLVLVRRVRRQEAATPQEAAASQEATTTTTLATTSVITTTASKAAKATTERAEFAPKKAPENKGKEADSKPEVTSFSVESWLQLRYARTLVECRMKNPSTASAQAVQFQMILPVEAFISNFSLLLGDTEYVAEVKGAEEATELYKEAVEAGEGAALVEQDRANGRLFRVAVNLEPGDKVRYRLTYEELLERSRGRYQHSIYAGSPGQPVDNYTIVVHVDESLPLVDFSVEDPLSSNNNNNNLLLDDDDDEQQQPATSSGAVNNNSVQIIRNIGNDSSRAEVRFQPSRAAQVAAGGPGGLSGELTVSYDVDRGNQTSEVQVVDGYFVHYFTPDQLPVLPKHVTFVLDQSGSMVGEKLQQLKDAMFTILNDLGSQDFFTIFVFSSNVYRWSPDEGEDFGNGSSEEAAVTRPPMPATPANKQRAIAHILGLQATDATNINEALLKAVQHTGAVAASGLLPAGVQSIIIFLTDGQPTEGVTEGGEIRQNIVAANNRSGTVVPIHCIAFGADADFSLVKDISREAAGGFARQIYEGADAALQLEDFYGLVASPLLAQLKFDYLANNNVTVTSESLTATQVGTLYRGGEFVVAGQLRQDSSSSSNDTTVPSSHLTVKVAGVGAEAKAYSDQLSICLWPIFRDHANWEFEDEECRPPRTLPPRSEAQNFLQHLHAFLNIRQLLKAGSEAGRQRAKELALQNNFVTPVTSLLVRKPDGDQDVASTPAVEAKNSIRPLSASLGSASLAGASYDEDEDDYVVSRGVSSSLSGGKRKSANRLVTTTPSFFHTTDFHTTTIHFQTDNDIPATADVCGSPADSSQLTLFTATYHRAENVTLTDSSADLSGGVGAKAVSARLAGACCWRLYAETDYAGLSVRLVPGHEYKSVTSLGELLQKVKSAKRENCNQN